MTWFRRLLYLVLVLLALWVLIPPLSGLPSVRGWFEGALARATGWDVTVGELRLGYDLSLSIKDLALAAPSQAPFVTVKRLRAGLRLQGALSGRVLSLLVEAPALHVARLPSLPRSAAEGPGTARLPLEGAEVVDGYLYLPAKGGDIAVGPFGLSVESFESASGLRLGGETKLPGESGTAEWSAELAAEIPGSRATVTAKVARLGDLAGAWSIKDLPAAVAETAVSLDAELKGVSPERVEIGLKMLVQPGGGGKSATLEGRGEVHLPETRISVQVGGSGIEWSDPTLARAASGLAVQGRVAAVPKEGGLTADVELKLSKGEVLWDRFYADIGKNPVGVRGKMELAGAALAVRDGNIAIAGVGQFSIAGRRDGTQESWRIGLDLDELDHLFAIAVRDPLKEDFPILEETDLRGRLSGVIEFERKSGRPRRLGGAIDLRLPRIAVVSPAIEISGLRLQLPIALTEGAAPNEAARNGIMEIGTISVGGINTENIAFPLAVEPNMIKLTQPVQVAVLGGSLDFQQLEARLREGLVPQAQIGLGMRGLDLQLLTRAAGWPVFTGTLTGEIPNLTVSDGQIRSDGEMLATLFGGHARISNVRVDQLFSPVPTLQLELGFDNISLGEMTGAFEVGRITGIVSGGVHDLAIVNRQPLHFEAWLESKPTPGVSQRISVTAIRQLSILGGAGGDPFTQGVLSFFDEYRYAKMGFRCRLENDRFTLQGIEQFEGQEYLVVGATIPPRVNVVSHTRVIAFSEMLQRLARVLAVGKEAPETRTEN